MFIRTENFRSFLRLYPIISILVAIHILLWAIISLPLPFGTTLMQQMVGYNYLVSEGEFWRLITPIFVHAGFTHMLFNSFSLVLFGPALERMAGKIRFIIAYLLSGIIANIATFYLEPVHFMHVGSSGAIFGLFGIYFYMVFIRKDLIDQTNSQLILTILVIGLIMTFINSNVNIIAHLFGFFGGAILAPLVLPKTASGVFQQIGGSSVSRRRIQLPNKFTPKHIIWIIIVILVIIGLFVK